MRRPLFHKGLRIIELSIILYRMLALDSTPKPSVRLFEEVRTQLIEKTIQTMQQITADTLARKEGYLQNPEKLTRGIYYPYDYFTALGKTSQTSKAEQLQNEDLFFHGHAPTDFFELSSDNESLSGKRVCTFVLKKGVLPGAALKAIREGLSILGCGETCQIAQWTAVQDILGDQKFNALFAAGTKTPLIIGSRLSTNPISVLRNYLKEKLTPSTRLKKGDHVFLNNISYHHKHPLGPAVGFNLICVDDTPGSEKFCGLGLPPEGVTWAELFQQLVSDYNAPPCHLGMLSERTKRAYLKAMGPEARKQAETLKEAMITIDDFTTHPREIEILDELNAKLVTLLANSTLEKGRDLLDSLKPKVGTRQN